MLLPFIVRSGTGSPGRLGRFCFCEIRLQREVHDGARVVVGGAVSRDEGRVENHTDEDAGAMTYVAVLCYNKKGDYIGALWTILTDGVPAGERSGFETMSANWPVKDGDVAETVAYAYKYQFQF